MRSDETPSNTHTHAAATHPYPGDPGDPEHSRHVIVPELPDEKIAVDLAGVTVSYSSKPVLRHITVRIPRGVMTSITGPNGSGKTTLLRSLLGLIPVDAGEIRVFGEPVDKVRTRIAYVPQTETVDWDFPITAEEVVMMGRYPYLKPLRRPGKTDHELVRQALSTVGMTEFADRHIRQLSGGQQQRVFIARALAQQADMMILDEPFTGIDAQTEKALFELIERLSRDGKTLLIVNHDLSLLDRFDFVILLNGAIIAAGPPEVAATAENVRLTYQGAMAAAGYAEQLLREGTIDVRR
ncbi:MAG: metal ABC transporter ATP-binding protein [Deltaproteobacteria bacterium]|nr:metal ABC transporter ATP-binding protein [Deltaproteobacteria bacterium]